MNNNYCVILAGGTGRRFWPLSKAAAPKQFLDLLGTGYSLLQMTFQRIAEILPKENIIVITQIQYGEIVRKQLPDLLEENLLLEPQRRRTAPCITWAAQYINSLNPQANMLVVPSDHLITNESEYRRSIMEGLNFVAKEPILLTIGITPIRPETEFGYIQTTDQKEGPFHKVKTFTEKPPLELAQVFFESGEFFWNSGIFMWSVKTILAAIERYQPDIYSNFSDAISSYLLTKDYRVIEQCYTLCLPISIDFGIMEKADNVYMGYANFGWSDLGTWSALHQLAPQDNFQNAKISGELISFDSYNNVVSTVGDKLVVLQGLSDYIVADSPNVLLICHRSQEGQIRQMEADVQIEKGSKYA